MALELATRVLCRARQAPHDPWLFAPRGLGWRFVTVSGAAAELERRHLELAPLSGRVVAYPWRTAPERWLLDLALQRAGAFPMPLPASPPGSLPGRAAARRSELLVDEKVPLAVGPETRLRSASEVVMAETGIERRDEEALAEQVEALSTVLGRAAGREIVLVSGELEQPELRLLLSWATEIGATVVFEPSPRQVVATLLWARPTVCIAEPSTLGELRLRMERGGRWRRRRSLGRLRAVLLAGLLAGPEPLLPEERTYWHRHGVRLVSYSTGSGLTVLGGADTVLKHHPDGRKT